MPVLVQAPNVGPQNLGDRFISGLDASRSLMDRADANTRANAAEARQQQIFDATAPLREVTQQAQMAKARAQIQGYGIAQEATINVNEMVPHAVRDFAFMAQIPDSQARADYAIDALSRYSQLALVPELKPMFDTFNHTATQIIQDNEKIKFLKRSNNQFLESISGLSPDEQMEAKRVHAGLAGRASGAGQRSVQVVQSDGSVQMMTFDPRTGKYALPQVDGGQGPAAGSAGGEPLDVQATPVDEEGAPPAQPAAPVNFRGITPGQKKAQETKAVADAKYEQKLVAEKPKRQYALQKAEISTQRLSDDLDEIIKQATSKSVGAGGAILGHFAGTDAKDIQANLDTVKADIMLQAMADLKAASPTGATGLGSQTEQEGERLSAQFGSLSASQSPAQFIANVKKVQRRLHENYGLTRNAYEMEYKESAPSAGDAADAPASAPAPTVGGFKIIEVK